jgi:hypothetical protein
MEKDGVEMIITYEGNPSTVIPRTPSALRPVFFPPSSKN